MCILSLSVCLSVIMNLTKRKKGDRNFLFWEMSEFREGKEVSGSRACMSHQSLNGVRDSGVLGGASHDG